MSAKVVSVILTDLTRLGDGIEEPVRRVYQIWTLDGKLLAEVDPTKVGSWLTDNWYGPLSA